MPRFTATKHLPHPVEDVFAASSDFANAADNVEAITKTEILTDGPVGVGTRFTETRVIFKREATETMEVSVFDPPNRYVLLADSCGTKYETTLDFEPRDGGTQLTMTFDARPYTIMGKIMGFIFRPMMKSMLKMVEKDFDDLSASLTARQRST